MAEIKSTESIPFIWTGLDKAGKKVKGELLSRSVTVARAELRKQGVRPTNVRKKPKALFGSGGKRKKKIITKDITIFARQLATMMGAGVPLVQSFDIVARGHDNPSMQDLLLQVKATIEGGSTLAESLRKHPDQFDALFCNLVEAGEQAGVLETLLDKIATYKEKTEALKAKIKKALAYPIGVLVVAGVVTAILLIFVVPTFEELFQGFGADLPAFTQWVIDLSNWMQEWWFIILAGIFIFINGFKYLNKHWPKFSHTVDRLVLKLPVVGDLQNKAVVARFARTLSTMSAAGVPLVEALVSVAGASGNYVYYTAIMGMRDGVATGQQLQAVMKTSGIFPNMVVQMVAIGEESGAIDSMLEKVADFYEEEVDNAVDALTSLLEPLIMSFLGVVVGGLVLAMYLPIFKMGSVV